MSISPAILLVEEDDFTAELMGEMLSNQFQLSRVKNGQEALFSVENTQPDIILLNLGNSGLSGLETCQSIRNFPDFCSIPIIFLSEHTYAEELFSVYEAGGDDYLPCSVSAMELCSRISHALEQQKERSKLKEDLSQAFSVAMTAMSSAAEVGEILQFLRASFTCTDYYSICKEVLKTLNSFGLDARVQIRGTQQTVSYSELGPCNTIEESIFSTMSKQGRLFSFSTHSACTYEHITLIVKNMPHDNADRYGRMSDNLALLCEAANERVMALDNEILLLQQKEAFKELVNVVNVSLLDLNQQQIQAIQKAIISIQDQYNHLIEQLNALTDVTQVQETLKTFEIGSLLDNLVEQVTFQNDIPKQPN